MYSNKQRRSVADRFEALYRQWRRDTDCVVRQGVLMTKNDSDDFHRMLLTYSLIVIEICEDINLGTVVRWANYCATMDVYHFGRMLKDYTDWLLTAKVKKQTYKDFCEFQAQLQRQYLGSCPKMLVGPVKWLIRQYTTSYDAESFKQVYQFLAFPGRLAFRELPLDDEAISKYVELEERVKNTIWSNRTELELQSVITGWFGDFDFSDFRPRHGSGAVSEHRDDKNKFCLYDKYKLISYTSSHLYCLQQIDSKTHYLCGEEPITKNKGISTLTSVPKSILTRRWICKEPATNMYLQKGVMHLMYDYICEHKFLKRVIPLRSPEQNARMARDGSVTGEYATIDMSDASDTIPFKLVKRIFAGTPLWIPFLKFRTSYIRIPGEKEPRKLHKNAPMGSALCFPTMCTLIAALCYVAIMRSGCTPKSDDFSVYGDDIVIRVQFLDELLALLKEVGFIVNTSKSFTTGPFRESCGGEYYDGMDVTPVRIPRKFNNDCMMWEARSFSWYDKYVSYEVINDRIELINRLYDFKFIAARFQLLRELFVEVPRRLWPPFSADGSVGIKSADATNFHLLPGDYHHDYQLEQYTFGDTISPNRHINDAEEDYELIRLSEWYTQYCHDASLSSLSYLYAVDRVANVDRSTPIWEERISPLQL